LIITGRPPGRNELFVMDASFCVLQRGRMSLDSEVVTLSIDQYQPQPVIGRQRVQLRASSEDLQQTGNGIQPLEDDVIVKMASQVTADVINAAVKEYRYIAEQSLGSEVNGEQYPPLRNREPAAVSSDAIQPPSTTETTLAASGTGGVEGVHVTGSQSSNRSTDVAAVSSHYAKPETLSSTSGDGPEAEALQDIARLQAITRQLRAAVVESRSADGLPVDVDDNETRTTSSKDLEQQATETTTNKENDDTVDCL